MSPIYGSYFVLFIAFSTGCVFKSTFAVPITNSNLNPYQSFIEYLVKSNCSMPSAVRVPFTEPSDGAPFSYLSEPLKECQTHDALEENNEAYLLCNEIFEVLQNITCVEYKTPLPEIQSEPLSKDVCKDFKVKQTIFPKNADYLSSKLGDPMICKILCSPGKYHHLCESLLWSYDVLLKIKSTLESAAGNIDSDKSDSGKKGSSTVKSDLVISNETDTNNPKVNDKIASGIVKVDAQLPKDENAVPKGSSNLHLDSNEKSSDAQNNPPKIDSSVKDDQKKTDLNGPDELEVPVGKIELQTNNKDLATSKSNENLANDQEKNDLNAGPQPGDKKADVSPLNSKPVASDVGDNVDNQHPEIEDAKNSAIGNQKESLDGNEEAKNNPPLPENNADNLIPKISPADESKSQKSNLENTAEDKQKDKSNSTKLDNADVNTNSNEKLDNSVPQDTEMDNELNNVNLGQENESKMKQPNSEVTDDGKKTEKPKLTDFESPLGVGSETDSKPTESTTLELLPDKEEEEHEHQEEKDPDQYNDTENEGDYAKSEYDNLFNPPLKNKEVEIKSSDFEGPNQISSNYDTFISSRNNIGRVPDDGPVISSLSPQEDGHFFFYFLSIVLILMAGYLIFHNKQKIIALIVEGRHERRRRSHGSGYKKLETK